MNQKISDTIAGLSDISNKIEDKYNNGVIDGFSDKPVA